MASYRISAVCEPIQLGKFLLERRRFPAIYFLYHGGNVVYVGQSKCLSLRIGQHLTEGVKQFDAVAFAPCSVNLLTEVESHYIRELAPHYNACTLTKKVKERESWTRDTARWKARRNKFQEPFKPGDPIDQFINVADWIIDFKDFGEFLMVSDRDVNKWRDEGLLTGEPLSAMHLMHFASTKEVRSAVYAFEELLA